MRSAQAQKKFRRRRGNLEIAAIEIRGEWCGRNVEQSLEKIPAGERAGRGEAVRKINLINVTGADVALGTFDGSEEF
jgi:hypothetical protein